MSIIINKKQERAWDLLNEGKLEEALKLTTEIEKEEGLAPEDKLKNLRLRGFIYFFLGDFTELLSLTRTMSKESKKFKKPLYLVQSILLKFGTLALITTDVSWDDINKAEQILKSVKQEPRSEIEETEAFLLHLKSWMYYWEQEYDLALELVKKCYSIFEQDKHWAFMLDWESWLMGVIYLEKGELKLMITNIMSYRKFSIIILRCFPYIAGSTFLAIFRYCML